MAERFLTTLPDGRLGIIPDLDAVTLAKTIFELSRKTHIEIVDGQETIVCDDPSEHFDPAIHTLDLISGGIPNHHPLRCRGCDETNLPGDRYFRNAWEDTGTTVRVNMPRARTIHMNRIRKARDAELAKLDAPYLKALETGDTAEQDRIATLKQELRNIPATFNLSTAKATATLASRWPEIIPKGN